MPDPVQNIIGQTIAQRWQITEFLGEGIMSCVYRAQDVETGKIIVLKLIKNNQKSFDLKSLEKEAKIFIALNHENIASYYNLFLAPDNRLFLFCDYLQGESLAILLSKKGKLSLEQSLQIFQQVSAGLNHAHEKRLWHGDLRPSNIFIVNDQFTVDEAKIVDFGFMNLIDGQSKKANQSTTYQAFTNAPYISPEQRTAQKIDQRCDLYTLGCLMYETVVGKPPYIGSSAMATAYKQKQQTTTALHDILPTHPLLSRYQAIVNKLLKANRQDRYQSAADLRADLDLISEATDSEWQKKANAFKQSTYSMLMAKRWHILATATVLILLLTIIIQATAIMAPYYQPWAGITNFNDSRLWVVQERQIASPSIAVVKQKYLLAGKLAFLKKNKQENSSDYTQALFDYSHILLACGQWQEAQNNLIELQKNASKNNTVRPADILANLALTYFMLSNLPLAEQYSKQVLTMVGQDSSWSDDKITALRISGDLYSGRDDNKQALATYEQLHKLAWEARLRDPSGYAYACALLADAYRKDEQYAQSEKFYKEAIDWGTNFIGQKHIFMAKALYGLALTQFHLNETAQAANQLQQALPIAVARQGPRSNFVIAVKRFRDYLLFHQNLFAWAKQHWN